jgi:hypothetical protein
VSGEEVRSGLGKVVALILARPRGSQPDPNAGQGAGAASGGGSATAQAGGKVDGVEVRAVS